MPIIYNAITQFREWAQSKYIPDYIIFYGTFLGFLFTSTGIHELGHRLVAWYYKCGSAIQMISLFNGSTIVGKCPDQSLIPIALAGATFSFILGLMIWFGSHEDSSIKVGAGIFWAYSVLPNIFPGGVPGSDINFAIKTGLPIGYAYLIFFIFTFIPSTLVALELWDRNKCICPTSRSRTSQ